MDSENSFLDYSFINFTNTESLLTTSQYAKVVFHNVEEKYDANNDLICQYSLTEQFIARTDDRIVLFKLGWQQITDYLLFEWVSLPQNGFTSQVQFNAKGLPKDENEFYQLCYISSENTVCGASIPFQFTNSKDDLVQISTDSECFVTLQMDSSKYVAQPITESTSDKRIVEDSVNLITNNPVMSTTTITTSTTSLNTNNEISIISSVDVKQLIKMNECLQSELKKTNTALENCGTQICDLKDEILNLRDMLKLTQGDVSELKFRMDIANDEYKKLYTEKARVEKKYEKLLTKCLNRKKSTETATNSSSDNLGELDPLPPFPLLM